MQNPFPIEKLINLEFGNVDGFRDEELENTFIKTQFIQRFWQDKHSIIVGAMGSGKSALFSLLKNKSSTMGKFTNRTIVSIDENIPFSRIKFFIKSLNDIDERQVYQFIWKYHITQKLAEELSSFKNFPNSQNEININNFLLLTNSKREDISILGKLIDMINGLGISFSTEIANTPIKINAAIDNKNQKKEEINLDRILDCCSSMIEEREMGKILIIIDKIDTFVAGEEYSIQKKYIESLLEVDDNMSISHPSIKLKIFLRKDLFLRLDFERLGYDKVQDNKLDLKWTKTELIQFLGSRLKNAFEKEDIIFDEGLDKFKKFKTKTRELFYIFIPFKNKLPIWIKSFFLNLDSSNIERKDISRKELYRQHLITKVFPLEVIHKDKKCKDKKINIFIFLSTHFFNGNNEVSPRNLLIFLKEVNALAISYYDDNRDQYAPIVYTKDNIPEWTLYRRDFIYQAYLNSTEDFIKSIMTANNKWKKYVNIFLQNRGNKRTFDLEWISKKTKLNYIETGIFCAYLESIGFLRLEGQRDIEIHRRKYTLPIIYMPRCRH